MRIQKTYDRVHEMTKNNKSSQNYIITSRILKIFNCSPDTGGEIDVFVFLSQRITYNFVSRSLTLYQDSHKSIRHYHICVTKRSDALCQV